MLVEKISNFIQFIDNGMYSLSLKEGKGAANLDSDDDNEVFGQVVCNDEMGQVLDDAKPKYYLCSRCKGCFIFMSV